MTWAVLDIFKTMDFAMDFGNHTIERHRWALVLLLSYNQQSLIHQYIDSYYARWDDAPWRDSRCRKANGICNGNFDRIVVVDDTAPGGRNGRFGGRRLLCHGKRILGFYHHHENINATNE